MKNKIMKEEGRGKGRREMKRKKGEITSSKTEYGKTKREKVNECEIVYNKQESQCM